MKWFKWAVWIGAMVALVRLISDQAQGHDEVLADMYSRPWLEL